MPEWILGARTKIIKDAKQTMQIAVNQTFMAEEVPATAGVPPRCTASQLEILRKQLSPERCIEYAKTPWMKKAKCSFSNHTKCGNSNPYWLYDFHKNHIKKFRGIFVGCNKGNEAIDLLRSLSSNETYNVQEWMKEFGKTNGNETIDQKMECEIPTDKPRGSSEKDMRVYCIDGAPNTIAQLEKTKTALSYGNELEPIHSIIGEKHVEDGLAVKITDPIGYTGSGHFHWANECKKKPKECGVAPATSIDAFVNTKPDLKGTIDYLSISAEGSDYEILKGAARTLNRIQYIDFGYNWLGLWEHQELQDLIYRLQKKGFVCYFTNPNNNLWRITDCWQDHYELKFKASIGCANANIPQAEPLLNKMEELFVKTLQKTTI